MSEQGENKLSRSSLIGLVIGSMIGGGAFNLMSDMGGQAGGLAIIIGWVITAIGMISLAFVFQTLQMNDRILMAVYTVMPKLVLAILSALQVHGDIGSLHFRERRVRNITSLPSVTFSQFLKVVTHSKYTRCFNFIMGCSLFNT